MEHKITVIKNPSKKAVEFVEYLMRRREERKKLPSNSSTEEIDLGKEKVNEEFKK